MQKPSLDLVDSICNEKTGRKGRKGKNSVEIKDEADKTDIPRESRNNKIKVY